MKRKLLLIIPLLAALFSQGCKEHYVTYDDKEYVMFADTAKMYVVREDILSFEVPVVSTTVCDYDRNFAVEILDPQSDAVEGRDFVLESNNFTIRAGEQVATIRVKGQFDNLTAGKDMHFTLRLVLPDRLVMPLYGDRTIVRFRKSNKFDRSRFTGYAVVSSLFLYQYSLNGRFQRLISTCAHPTDPNAVVLKDFLADGYDVTISFDDDTDPVNPTVDMPSGQVVSDEGSIFGMVHGDNHILIETSNQGPSYFFGHAAVAVMVNRFYVQNLGDDIGTVGHFLTEIDWVSDEEAMRLKREDGM